MVITPSLTGSLLSPRQRHWASAGCRLRFLPVLACQIVAQVGLRKTWALTIY
jgi:hypothetical protein